MNKDYFKNSNVLAEIASAEITKYLQTTGWTVTNVERDKEYQALDIDLVINREEEQYTVEIKGDQYGSKTSNYFCETISNTSKNTPGCFYATQSDYIFYYFLDTFELHVIPTKEAQKWLKENEYRYKKVNVKTTGAKGEYWYSNEARLVPRRDMQRALDIQIIDFKQYFNINVA